MNLLRKMYEEMEAAKDKKYQGGVPFIELSPSKKEDKAAIDSFLREHFPNSIDARVANTEIFTNLYESLSTLDIGVLIRYNDSKMSEGALYFRLNAMNDPALAQLLKERNVPGEAHIHVWGKDVPQAMGRLGIYFAPLKEETAQQTLKPAEYAVIKKQNSMLYTEMSVPNEQGLHFRSADQIVTVAEKYLRTKIKIYNLVSNQVANAKSIMEVTLLAATKGTMLKVETKGQNAENALKEIIGLFENKFGEE